MFGKKFYKFISFALFITIFLLALSGCSSEYNAINQARNSATNEELIKRYRAYLSRYPGGQYTGEAREQIELAIIRLAGQGNGIPEAAEFEITDTETFRLFIIEKYEARPGEILITGHEWNAFLPENWAANTIYEA